MIKRSKNYSKKKLFSKSDFSKTEDSEMAERARNIKIS